MQGEGDLEKLQALLIRVAEETGVSYEAVVRCAIAVCDCMIREENANGH